MHKVTSADGTPIAYERSGDGPVVIVVGGAFNDRGSAVPLAEALAPQLSVVRFDRRGRGDSGDSGDYHVDREVEDLRALVDEIGGKPSVFGMSSGGALALRAAAAGVPMDRLAVYEVPFVPDDDAEQATAAERARALKSLLAEERRADAVIEFMTSMGMPEEMAAQMRHAPMFPALESLAHTLAYDLDVMGAEERGSAIPADLVTSVHIPVLAICGGAGSEATADTVRRLSALLPDGRHAILPGQTHDVAPAAIAPVLADFFTV